VLVFYNNVIPSGFLIPFGDKHIVMDAPFQKCDMFVTAITQLLNRNPEGVTGL
jgi:hypothetical protein